ncbi:ABC transporter ATP-binding protein [Nonomuraea sp. SBT364]|uniref:ABC transporter ATP-binding protein n=1 Tax=Nonomuraea sp. SBT364 TaxID=1580530 RepID=UPI00066C1552|nr:ATP-binding cassette domain-containing protein [Nonomuraea sp. SBT364]
MINTTGLTKTYEGGPEAVANLTMSVAPGEIVGFLGPNGAGKTTAMRMLTTLLKPTSGSAVVAGHDLLGDPREVRRRIGYVSQSGGVDPAVPLGEELEVQAMLYGLSRARASARAAEVLALLDLTGLETRPGGALSGGQRRRVDIAFALTHRPVLLFLDEPTTGLDPRSRAALWDHVRRLRAEQGVTVFLTTHYLDEADALCDRLLIMDRGRIVAEGAPAALKTGGRTLDEVFLDLTGRPLGQEAGA